MSLHSITPIGPWISDLGESPVWHNGCLYWCDITGHAFHRYNPQHATHTAWTYTTDIACCTPVARGGWLLACRDGLVHFDETTGLFKRVREAPYNPAQERFNDGKCDTHGRFWVGTYAHDQQGGLYCYTQNANGHYHVSRKRQNIHISNGLAFDPKQPTVMYWADTPTHQVMAFHVDPDTAALSEPKVFFQFNAEPGPAYKGRPDGATVDAEGCYWVAMYEGGRIVRLSPEGQWCDEMLLPVTCPTMVCFGGPTLNTLYITTARENRPAEELAQEPLAGCVLQVDVAVQGVPGNMVKPLELSP
jgi:sugar lactone lactonase YvrE